MGYGQRQRHPAPGEAIYRDKKLTASYLHLFFPSNPRLIAALFTGQLQTEDKAKLLAWENYQTANMHAQSQVVGK